MVPETHRQNEGRCFSCFFDHQEIETSDREELLDGLVADRAMELPESYRDFLLTYDGRQRLAHRRMRGKNWQMASIVPTSRSPLTEIVNVDGIEVEFHSILSAYARSLGEVAKAGGSKLPQVALDDTALERLSRGFAIGSENSDILFIDGDDQSVRCFHHEGDIEKVSRSFEAWLSAAKSTSRVRKKTAKSLLNKVEDFVGYWSPDKSSVPEGTWMLQDYEWHRDGRARCVYHVEDDDDPRSSESFGYWRLFGRDGLGFLMDDVEITFRREPGRLVDEDGIVYRLS